MHNTLPPVELPQTVNSNQLFDVIWNGLPDALLLVKENGEIENFNQRALELFEYKGHELVGAKIEKLIPARFCRHQDMRRFYMVSPHERKTMTVDNLMGVKSGGEEFYADVSLRPLVLSPGVMVIVFVRDISERVKLEKERKDIHERLLLSQKVSSIGQLACEMAHDFNNILAATKGRLELLLECLDESKETQLKHILHMNRILNHAYDLTTNLMSYIRREDAKAEEIDLLEIVNNAVEMISAIFPASVQITIENASHIPSILIAPSKFKQVLINLCMNAKDAMPDGGHINIGVSYDNIEHAVCSSCDAQVSGMYVVMSISDNGYGIDEKHLGDVFRPLYTTKKVGEGTGMGLSVVNNIVHEYGGHIVIESSKDCGTRFNVMLPAYNASTQIQCALQDGDVLMRNV